jgi:hypothetical protein
MSAEDELAFPEVPEAKPEDPEDVSWALSTAEAMWARGDHLEGIKWVRKAAEAASDAEQDERHLELAKAASELASLIARRSRASLGDHGAPSPAVATANAPTTARSSALPPPAPLPSSSAAPPPAPSSASGPAPSMGKSAPPGSRSVPPAPLPLPSRASAPPKAPVPPRGAPRPVAPLATSDARQGPQAGRGILTNRTVAESASRSPKARRRSRENLDAEARAAGVLETAPQTAVDGSGADRTLDRLAHTSEVTAVVGVPEQPPMSARAKRRSRPEPDPTIIGNRDDLLQAERAKSAEHWDASPTENLTGEEMDHMNEGDRKTTAFTLPKARPPSVAPPPARAPASTVHDPEIQTSQAVRVVVWRDGTGVHIAPAGTVVSSITIDAVLVVLEPSADLTAWLSQRER